MGRAGCRQYLALGGGRRTHWDPGLVKHRLLALPPRSGGWGRGF